MSTQATKDALCDAALRVTITEGVRSLTARRIADEAGVNQALVFYHFNGVNDLLRVAYAQETKRMVGEHQAMFTDVSSFAELHEVGVRLADRSRHDGSAAVLAQVVAAARSDPVMAELLRNSLQIWHAGIRDAVEQALAGVKLDGDVDVDGLASTLAAATVGMITVDAANAAPGGSSLDALGPYAKLADRLLRLVPRALARRVQN